MSVTLASQLYLKLGELDTFMHRRFNNRIGTKDDEESSPKTMQIPHWISMPNTTELDSDYDSGSDLEAKSVSPTKSSFSRLSFMSEAGDRRDYISIGSSTRSSASALEPIAESKESSNIARIIPDKVALSYSVLTQNHNMVSKASYRDNIQKELSRAINTNLPDHARVEAFQSAIENAERSSALGDVISANMLVVLAREGLKKSPESKEYLVEVDSKKGRYWYQVTNNIKPNVGDRNVLNITSSDSKTKLMADFIEISRFMHGTSEAHYTKEYADKWHRWLKEVENQEIKTPHTFLPHEVQTALHTYRLLHRNPYL